MGVGDEGRRTVNSGELEQWKNQDYGLQNLAQKLPVAAVNMVRALERIERSKTTTTMSYPTAARRESSC